MAICDKWSELVFQPDGGPNYMCTNQQVPLNILLPISNKAGDYKTKKVLHVIFQS
jgi:hypothetical protein